MNYYFSNEVAKSDLARLSNQVWKLIPMRENNESWEKQLDSVLIEFNGLSSIFQSSLDFLILISKLEGLKFYETTFMVYRKTVFEVLNLIGDLKCKIQT